MTPQPPPGQGPLDPAASAAPPPSVQGGGFGPPPGVAQNAGGGPPRPQMQPPPMHAPYPPLPPPFMMPPPRAPGRGFGAILAAIVTAVATVIFVGSLLLNGALLVVVASSNSSKPSPTIVQTPLSTTGDARQKIAVVRLQGVILDDLKQRFFEVLDSVEADVDVKALVIEIDSPGGGVTASDEIYERLVRLKREKNIKIVVSMSSLAASGGYYIACAGDQIVAQRTTWTGSIGVILPRYDLSEGASKLGIKDDSIIADGAFLKNSLSPLRPLDSQERSYANGLVNEAYDTFKDVVKTGRQGRLKAPIEEIATGAVFSSQTALRMGLVDQIGYLDDAVALAKSSAGLTNPQAVLFEREVTLFDVLGGNAASRNGSATKIPGVDLQLGELKFRIDRELIYDLTQPRAMYLWPGR